MQTIKGTFIIYLLLIVLSDYSVCHVYFKDSNFIYLFIYFSFLHLALITELFITENRKILSRRGARLGRLMLCPLVKLYIMTAKKKKNRYTRYYS